MAPRVAMEPALMLFDEPTSALVPERVGEVPPVCCHSDVLCAQ